MPSMDLKSVPSASPGDCWTPVGDCPDTVDTAQTKASLYPPPTLPVPEVSLTNLHPLPTLPPNPTPNSRNWPPTRQLPRWRSPKCIWSSVTPNRYSPVLSVFSHSLNGSSCPELLPQQLKCPFNLLSVLSPGRMRGQRGAAAAVAATPVRVAD